MPAPTIERHGAGQSSGGTTGGVLVTIDGPGRIIFVCSCIGTQGTSIIPTATISSANPNIGSWTLIGHMPSGTSTPIGAAIYAWYAVSSGSVSAITVTITASATIDDIASAYVTLTGANTTQPLDQNTTLATGSSSGSSAVDYLGTTHNLFATISTNTANILVCTVVGINANRVFGNPTAGTTITESLVNAGGARYASLGVFTAPFTTVQSGTNVGSTNVNSDPLFAFGITADSQAGGGTAAQARALVLA